MSKSTRSPQSPAIPASYTVGAVAVPVVIRSRLVFNGAPCVARYDDEAAAFLVSAKAAPAAVLRELGFITDALLKLTPKRFSRRAALAA